jgi:uncharacterized protein (DUF302 family)
MSDYGYAVEVAAGYDEAVVRARLALRGEGFSIITESHVGGLLGPPGAHERQYLFMGAFDTALEEMVDPHTKVSVQLPCNVVVQEIGDSAIVAALDPADSVEPGATLPDDVAARARAALERVLLRVSRG